MKVFIKKHQLAYFRRKAKESENEQLAYLVGRQIEDGVKIFKWYYPKLQLSTPFNVQAEDGAYEKAVELAKFHEMELLGSIHSHPGGYPPIMSNEDYGGHLLEGSLVCGIVGVDKNWKTFPVFWSAHSALSCDIHYF